MRADHTGLKPPPDDQVIVRHCRGQRLDKHGRGRWLKPHPRHGVYFIGPMSRDRAVCTAKISDAIVPLESLPPKVRDRLRSSCRQHGHVFFHRSEIHASGYPVPEPRSRLGWWWQRFWEDDGGMGR